MLERFFKRKPAPSMALRGAPSVRRQKTYSAQTGLVYQYFYEGHRASERTRRPGNEYVFLVSTDRKSNFPLTVFLPAATVESWQQLHGRKLSPTEQYAAVKMSLFETFDERADLGPANAEVEIDEEAIERLLATLEIE
ncbi:MAG: hypothetical protein HY236_01765 [Acidobacteria bacterium]|nr:hypothetical protein [Acidobacteriota bacterium]